jgi:RNA polymerase sigma-70 factor (ECF subfamily)
LDSTPATPDAQDAMADIRACLSGEQAAYRRVVDRHKDQVWRLMSRFSRNPAVIGELSQEVFVEAWLCLDKYRARGPFGAWLRTVAVRVGYRYWREQGRRRARESDLPDSAWAMVQAPKAAAPSEAAETLYQFLEWLEPRDRLVLTLAYWEGLDTRDIARATGWTHTLVRVRMHRARSRLKKLIESGLPKGGKVADKT